MNKDVALRVAGVIFLLVAIIHILRVMYGFSLIIADKAVPIWINVVAFVISLVLSIWMFRASSR